MRSLSEIQAGTNCEVKWIILTKQISEYFEKMGIVVGAVITVIVNTMGHMIVQVADKRLALSVDVASKIKVGSC